jgi:hypothetical protein
MRETVRDTVGHTVRETLTVSHRLSHCVDVRRLKTFGAGWLGRRTSTGLGWSTS